MAIEWEGIVSCTKCDASEPTYHIADVESDVETFTSEHEDCQSRAG